MVPSLPARAVVGRCPITRLPITRAMAERDIVLIDAMLDRIAKADYCGIPAGPLERRRRELAQMVERRGR